MGGVGEIVGVGVGQTQLVTAEQPAFRHIPPIQLNPAVQSLVVAQLLLHPASGVGVGPGVTVGVGVEVGPGVGVIVGVGVGVGVADASAQFVVSHLVPAVRHVESTHFPLLHV